MKITWIQPRVLDLERINIIREKLDQWNFGLDLVIKKVEKSTAEVQSNSMMIE